MPPWWLSCLATLWPAESKRLSDVLRGCKALHSVEQPGICNCKDCERRKTQIRVCSTCAAAMAVSRALALTPACSAATSEASSPHTLLLRLAVTLPM